MVAAGLLLNHVQYWTVFTEVKLIIMVPALLGLKGNLEMTLASRLSTAYNLGKFQDRHIATSLILGNMFLAQTQAIIVGFLASLVGILVGCIQEQKVELSHSFLLCASALVTASLASLILGILMVIVILVAGRFRCNPDNVATPIAAGLGDVTTLGLLSWIADFLYQHILDGKYTAVFIIGIYFLVLLPIFTILTYKNIHTNPVLKTGWTPILSAMLISLGGGFILEKAIKNFKIIALFTPVMNGAGGNIVAIQASRMTTYLNKSTNSLIGTFSNDEDKVCVLPCSTFCAGFTNKWGGNVDHASSARILTLLLLPCHMIFVFSICLLEKLGPPTPLFVFLYLLAAFCQVSVLLYLCQILVYLLWSRGTDPDNAAIPYLTAVGDLLGTGFLVISFLILQLQGDNFITSYDLTTGDVMAGEEFDLWP